MPVFETVEKDGHVRHVVKLEPGEKVALCRCYESKLFPFCDGSHKQADHNIGPAEIEITTDHTPPPQV